MRPLIALLFFALAGCSSPAMDPDLSLHDRFVLVALHRDDGSKVDDLLRWYAPLTVFYEGPDEYRDDVFAHMELLGELTGLETGEDDLFAKMRVEISDYDTGSICQVQTSGGNARVFIREELPRREIRQCIVQEMTQALGLGGDLDGPFGSRSDTAFASYGGSLVLTEYDIALVRILFDDRLRNGMRRDQVLEVLPEIISDLYPEQASR